MEYRIIRSGRKTLGLTVKADGVTVRAPYSVSAGRIEKFVKEHTDWIEKSLAKQKAAEKELEGIEPLTDGQIRELAQKAQAVIPERVGYYAPIVGVRVGRITIRNQRTKWGSCAVARGNLNFNCLLMLAPPEVLDCIVVHELCHLKVAGHSAGFYEEVLRVYPEYPKTVC